MDNFDKLHYDYLRARMYVERNPTGVQGIVSNETYLNISLAIFFLGLLGQKNLCCLGYMFMFFNAVIGMFIRN